VAARCRHDSRQDRGGTAILARPLAAIDKISAAGQKYADQVKEIQQQILDGTITPPDTVGSGT